MFVFLLEHFLTLRSNYVDFGLGTVQFREQVDTLIYCRFCIDELSSGFQRQAIKFLIKRQRLCELFLEHEDKRTMSICHKIGIQLAFALWHVIFEYLIYFLETLLCFNDIFSVRGSSHQVIQSGHRLRVSPFPDVVLLLLLACSKSRIQPSYWL